MAVVRNKIKVNGWNVGGNYSSYTQQGRFFRGLFAGDVVGMEVKQATSLGMDIEVHQGSAILTKNTHSAVIAEIQDTISMTVPTADQSNPRIDTVVIYEDGAVVIPENVDEYWQDGDGGRFKVAIITGTASATPSGATDREISRVLNTTTYAKLAKVRVEARTTTITQGNITDIRQALTPRYVSTNNVDWTTYKTPEIPTVKRDIPAGWGSVLHIARMGNIVVCRYGGIMQSNPVNVAAKPGERLPIGFRPSRNMHDIRLTFRMISNHNHTGAGVFSIAHDGSFTIQATTGGMNEVHGTVTYFTDDPFPA